MTAMIEALSFLGPRWSCGLGMSSRVFIMTLCMLLVFAWAPSRPRTHVQLAFACQRSMILSQRKLRLTMQHVYGHSGNLGNECADHAAALGTLGVTSSHSVPTRWIHHNFDATACFDGCHSMETVTAHSNGCCFSFPITGFSLLFTIGFTVPFVHST